MRRANVLVAVWMTASVMVVMAAPVAAGGTVLVQNRSGLPVKAVGEGGGAVIGASTEPTPVTFEGGKDIGIDLKIWWVSKPRELCQLFVPWERTVVVFGTATIRCRSE